MHKPRMSHASQEMLPSADELQRISENTDPTQFLSDLAAIAPSLGLGPEPPKPPPPPAASSGGAEGRGVTLDDIRSRVDQAVAAGEEAAGPAVRPGAGGIEREPHYEISEVAAEGGAEGESMLQLLVRDRRRVRHVGNAPHAPHAPYARCTSTRCMRYVRCSPALTLRPPNVLAPHPPPWRPIHRPTAPTRGLQVRLPLLESLSNTDVDISDAQLSLLAPGNYRLQLAWPRAVSSDGAKAKFVKKSRSLKVTLPLK